MLPALSKEKGQCLGLPDTCLTPAPPAPPVPIPYPNIGLLMSAKEESKKVKLCQVAALTEKSEIPSSQGDEAGTNGGVMSGKNMGKIIFKQSSAKVKFEGAGAVCLSGTTGHNGSNANAPSGTTITPSQTDILIQQ